MSQPAYELIFALTAIALIASGYGFLLTGGVPSPHSAIGYSLGIVGFLLMLATETLYSLRKRWPDFNLGPTRVWLQLHIFTGLVGPFLVLLHTGWKFNGLAGTLTIVLGVVVFSGMVGRYIYLDGAALEIAEIEEQIVTSDQELQALGVADVGVAVQRLVQTSSRPAWMFVALRPWYRWHLRRQLRQTIENLPRSAHAQAALIEPLLAKRQRLQMEIRSLDVTRRLLALWHVFHIPLSAALFTLAFIHIGAVLYYATFMK